MGLAVGALGPDVDDGEVLRSALFTTVPHRVPDVRRVGLAAEPLGEEGERPLGRDGRDRGHGRGGGESGHVRAPVGRLCSLAGDSILRSGHRPPTVASTTTLAKIPPARPGVSDGRPAARPPRRRARLRPCRRQHRPPPRAGAHHRGVRLRRHGPVRTRRGGRGVRAGPARADRPAGHPVVRPEGLRRPAGHPADRGRRLLDHRPPRSGRTGRRRHRDRGRRPEHLQRRGLPGLVAALRTAHERGARIVSICSGAFALAAAGLLDGREATTHWRYAELLQQRYPLVKVNPDVLYVDHGSVLTSAGSAAGIDLCLHLVRSDHGAKVANTVARRFVVPPHRAGGQAQFIEAAVRPVKEEDDGIGRSMQWALDHLSTPLTITQLARAARMSDRSYLRHFTARNGTSPMRWVITQRIAASLPLLETPDGTVEEIATAVGFESAATFRHHFGRTMRTSPTAYRRAFGRGVA
ncbi:helix-turn-helix domain-containing protein [Kitasatospora gansuensis]